MFQFMTRLRTKAVKSETIKRGLETNLKTKTSPEYDNTAFVES